VLVNEFKFYERVIKLGSTVRAHSRKYHKETNGNRKVPTEVKVARKQEVALCRGEGRTSDTREPIMFSRVRFPRTSLAAGNMATRTNEGTNRKKINNKCGERKNPTSKEGTSSMWQHPITGCRVS
jgi:hypothetical protein